MLLHERERERDRNRERERDRERERERESESERALSPLQRSMRHLNSRTGVDSTCGAGFRFEVNPEAYCVPSAQTLPLRKASSQPQHENPKLGFRV